MFERNQKREKERKWPFKNRQTIQYDQFGPGLVTID